MRKYYQIEGEVKGGFGKGKYIRYTTPHFFCLDCEVMKESYDFYVSNKRHCKACLSKKYKRQVKPERDISAVNTKLNRLFNMIAFMAGTKRGLKEFADRFDISQRTARRYLNLIDSLDMGLEQDFDNRYFLVMGNCPFCGENHKSRGTILGKDVHQNSSFTPGFLN